MCGIAGIIRIEESSSPVTKHQLASMVQAISHRGPDHQDEQTLEDGSGFAHARLAILDLDMRSKQPFSSEDGDFVVVFNGEIFNYVELRQELSELGHRFQTESDTEVLLKAYIEWGDQCVDRFNGMWAFVVFDRKKRRFFCSRDRFGIKPFVYAIHEGKLFFASEAKAILSVLPSFRKPNFDSLSLLLRSSISGFSKHTAFAGIVRLQPAHNLVIEGALSPQEIRYWDYPTETASLPYDDACQQFLDLLSDSIRIRLRSDVPLGLTLSGGLDSSAIACLTAKNSSTALETFTASYRDFPQWDETDKANRLANQLGFRKNAIPLVRGEFIANVQKSVFHLETPHHSIAILPYWNIIKSAREKVTVLLEGQGADELLGGYVNVTSMSALKDDTFRFRPLEALKRLRLGLSGKLGFTGRRFAMELCRSVAPGLHDVYRSYRGDEQVYETALQDRMARLPLRRRTPDCSDSVTRSLRHQHERGLINLLLYGDSISMAHGLESRLPFMDYRLVEFVFRLPGNFKLRGGLGKAVLRDSTRKIVPDFILDDRRKLGFVSPVAEWIREDRSAIDAILNSKRCRERGIFNVKQMNRLIEKHVAGKVNVFSNIYRWLMTEIWFQEFID